MKFHSCLVSFCLSLTIWRVSAGDFFAQKCNSFSPQAYIPAAYSQVAEYIPAGTNLTFPYNDPSCSRPSQLISVDLCRVALSVGTSNQSNLTLELWLPRNWTGRFLGTGNGGMDGCIKYEDIAYGTSNGFASVGSNNGHNGTTAVALYHNLDVTIDFAWRALHTSVVIGKSLTHAFYGKPHSKSYYIGCSLGGRQGINSADAFPDDFDGIVAGSPAIDFNNLVSWRASFFPITGSLNSSRFITNDQWTDLIHSEILRQCDGIDGVLDGIIEDPSLCNFQPETLVCAGNQNDECLTLAEIETVRKVFSPMENEEGEFIYPAMQPGSEVYAIKGLYAGVPFSYSESWFRYVVYSPSWDPASFAVHDAQVADALNPGNIRTWPHDLSAFHQRGGKIIIFHGQQDDKITSFNTPRFYNYLSQGMQKSPAEMDDFLRFFRISGMFHCNSGPGAWVFGQGGGPSALGVSFNKDQNVLAALVAWVEREEAPDTIEGTKFIEDDPSLGIERQRRHCRYPLRNTYMGGDPSLGVSWRCTESG